MIFADLELARRIEAAEAAGAENNYRALTARAPELNPAFMRVAGGASLYGGPDSPLNQAIGLGMNGAVTSDEIDELEAFFRRRGSPAVVDLCPLADASLLAILRERGYRLTEFTNMLVRELDEVPEINPPQGIEIAEVEEADGEVWGRTVCGAFFEGHEVPPAIAKIFDAIFARPDVTCFLARADGEPACGGTLIRQSGLAGLYGTGTLPGARGRGAQGALIRARLAEAARSGCDLANSSTLPGTTSQRNLERHGFRVAYTKSQFVRELE